MHELHSTIQRECGVTVSAIFDAAEWLGLQQEEIDRLNSYRLLLLELLAIIHRDGGQYAALHGVEKACGDAGAQVATWLSTIESIDDLCEQARLAEREACALVCEQSSFPAFTARCFATDIRARAKP